MISVCEIAVFDIISICVFEIADCVISVQGKFGGYQFALSVVDFSFRSVLISQFVVTFDISV